MSISHKRGKFVSKNSRVLCLRSLRRTFKINLLEEVLGKDKKIMA